MNIVCIGGGHGLSQVLGAIKLLPSQLTAIVTTTDNGGSTGRLRKDKSQIAVGDLRRCVSALASQNHLLATLVEQRFESENDLNGHCFGNILISALTQFTNSPSEAIKLFCALLGVENMVLPMSNTPVDLLAFDKHNNEVFGECNIDALKEFPISMQLSKPVPANSEAVHAILNADLILLGPGSLLTSVLPPLLIKDIRNALSKTKACRIFIENLIAEGSVVDAIPQHQLVAKAIELVGFKFFDMALSPDAVMAMDLRNTVANTEHGLHCKTQLKYIIEQMIPSEQSSLNYQQIKVH